jgi:cytochrome c oxidase subunit 4
MSAHDTAHPHPETPMSLYYQIYAILMALLVVTVAVAYFHLGAWALPIALTIAFIKALLVIIYFMHMRYTGKLMWLYVITSIVWMFTLIFTVLIDVISRGH